MTTRDWDDPRTTQDAPHFEVTADKAEFMRGAWAEGYNAAVQAYCDEKYIDQDEITEQARAEGCICRFTLSGQRIQAFGPCEVHPLRDDRDDEEVPMR